MLFDEFIGLDERISLETIKRESVKCISIRGSKLLMIETKAGFLAFAGGKIEDGETHHEALKREVLEETGYECKRTSDMIGKTFLRRIDKYNNKKLYEARCYYYFCDLSDEAVAQRLSENELEMDIKPIWVSLDEAIERNESYQNSLGAIDYFIVQQKYVLSKIDELIKENLLPNFNNIT